jgi:hypothetical protein
MADFSAEGNVRVDYVATIANIAAPDVSSELNTTTPLSGWLTPEGWSPGITQNSVVTTSLASTYITSVPGTSGGPITLTLKKDGTPANDTAWNLFKSGPSGYLVAREGQGGAQGAWTAGDKVMVFPGKAHKAQMQPTATNSVRTFQVVWEPSTEPNLDATAAA